MITKEKFLAYDCVREDGKTNMFMVKDVIKYADEDYNVLLTKEECIEIMAQYKKYYEMYYAGKKS